MPGRSAVYARGGLVATSQPLATAAAVEVLAEGGNAADAAVAAMGVLYAVEPMLCGVGGDAFILYYGAAEQRVTALLGSGAAPLTATPEAYAARGFVHEMPGTGPLAVTVPGAVHATEELWRRFGSGRLPWQRLWQRAVDCAQGHPVAPRTSRRYAGAPSPFLPPGGRPPAPGTLLRQPELAATLSAIAEQGSAWFYHGPFARALEAHCRARGGLLTAADMAQHRTEVAAPLQCQIGPWIFCTTPPPSQGIILLQTLGLLGPELGDPLAAPTVHRMVEAKKLAFADRLAYLGDPAWVAVPTAGLLAPAYLRRRRAAIHPARAAMAVTPGDPWPYAGGSPGASCATPAAAPGEGDTTAFVVRDGQGNAAAVIISLFALWGAGEVVEGTGVVLNNRGRGFTLHPGHPNRLAPGKRPMHTLHPYLVLDERGQLAALGATPGGDNQPQWNLQVIAHLLWGGADPQEAVERPRWSSAPGTTPEPPEGAAFVLTMEDGFPAGVPEALEAMGHRLQRLGCGEGGGAAQLIARVDSAPLVGASAPRGAVYAAGSDPRADGCALGL